MKKTTNGWIRSRKKTVDKILKLQPQYESMTDEELKSQTEVLKDRLNAGASLNKILPEAFAIAGEAAFRTVGLRPYPVQFLAGIGLHEGKLVQQNTGEGKTLTAALPSYLNALTGNGVHVVTVNDYLVRRDAENIGRIHNFLGLSVGCVFGGTVPYEKKSAYACDITYVTNTELGFDYLRDNMVKRNEEKVLRGFSYCIVDEVDSVLIDEARTPLIISGNGSNVSKLFMACDTLVKSMERGKASAEFNRADAIAGEKIEETGDFIVHEKEKNVTLTESGVKKVEDFFNIECYAAERNIKIQHVMDQALKANYIMKRDKDYIVRNEEVLIVDEFTGRIMEGRQYSDGLHQAIEAKEGVPVQEQTDTIASTTYQNFFPLYKKLAGLTGTAYTERREFKEIYGLKTVVIPTNKPNIRKDHPDKIFFTKEGKLRAVTSDILTTHAAGQPVLAGTASVEMSEELSRRLKQHGITHEVLNAKQDKKEAEIIAKAGKYGAVTIATNMAGRGTDILIDEASRNLGGLKVIGTEKHESRRIDNQLRGRAGRQGDPGESVFYVSMEDDMARLFGSDKIKNVKLPTAEDDTEPVTSRIFRRAMAKAQKKVEDDLFASRKNVCDFDKVNNAHRLAVYQARNDLLSLESVSDEQILKCFEETIRNLVIKYWDKKDNTFFVDTCNKVFSPLGLIEEEIKGKNKRKTAAYVYRKVKEAFDLNRKNLTPEKVKNAFLSAIDMGWMEELKALDFLRKDIIYLQFAQKDARSMYSLESYKIYKEMWSGITQTASHRLFTELHQTKLIRITRMVNPVELPVEPSVPSDYEKTTESEEK